jgi:hypothetical protein
VARATGSADRRLLRRICNPERLVRRFCGLDWKTLWRLYSLALWAEAFTIEG